MKGTIRILEKHYWWPGWEKEMEMYVLSCPLCAQHKTLTGPPTGLLQRLPVPNRPWSHITMDFITDLPPSKGNARCAGYFPYRLLKSFELVDLLFQGVFRYYGLPEDIVSDRGP